MQNVQGVQVLKKKRSRKKTATKKTKPTERIIEGVPEEGAVRILSIDPGLQNMGWCVNECSRSDEALFIEWGTVYGSSSVKGTGRFVELVNQIDRIVIKHDIDVLAVEDYAYIQGKEQGMFAIPAFIGILKYYWYLKTGNEAMILSSGSWKSITVGNGRAQKPEVRRVMKVLLPPAVLQMVEEQYGKVSGKGEQDCLDAMGLGMCMCQLVRRQLIAGDTETEKEEV